MEVMRHALLIPALEAGEDSFMPLSFHPRPTKEFPVPIG
jgi:hypothetical protein